MQINAEKSPYLVEKLKIWMLPTLALICQEKTVDYVVGFDDLGGKDDFTTEVSPAVSMLLNIKLAYHHYHCVRVGEFPFPYHSAKSWACVLEFCGGLLLGVTDC